MTTNTNFDLSSADESSADNVTSQGASLNESRSPDTKNNATPFSKRYQRTRSYDESYFNGTNQKPLQKIQNQQQEQQSPMTNQPAPFHIRTPDVGANLYFGPDSASCFDPRRPPYDAYYGSGYIYPGAAFVYPPPFEPPAYALNCHSYTDAKTGASTMLSVDQRSRQFDSIYRSTPLLSYGANSYFGWHQRAPATPTVYRASIVNQNQQQLLNQTSGSSACLDAADLLVNSFPPADGKMHQPPLLSSYSLEAQTNTAGSILFEKETVSPFFNDRQKRNDRRRVRLSSAASFCGRSFGSSSIADDGTLRRSRVKLCMIVSILIIIVAVLVAMGIAVYSQIKTQNSVVKLVRQYRTAFVVTGGRQLDYDAELLNPQSQSFRSKAKEFERKIESVFRDSGLSSIYEGVEITAFRFVVEPPGMEVQFNIKIKVNVQLQVSDILAVMDDAIRHNANSAFQDSVIDPNSLSVENQHLSPPPPSPPPLRRVV